MKNPNFWTNPSMRSMDQNVSERMERGLSDVARSGGEPDTCEDMRRYSMSMDQTVMLPSSHYKGVVARPNGPWGAKIYEKNQRLWLGALNSEVDATRAYDGAVLKFRTQDAITDFSPVRDGDQETRFSRMHTGKIIDMVTAAHSAAMNNAEEPSWTEGSDLRDDLCQGMQRVVDGNANASAVVACLPGEHLFDKAVTPSDVGKLNRLVIPKQHAEKYFPLDINACEKGLLLDFQDNTGKVWRFRYSYWNSSQSYVLTKGWSRFVKDKKLEAGDIVSFQRGLAESHQLYINCRRRPSCQATQRIYRRSQQSKGGMVYPVFGSSSLNPFNSGAQATVLYNSQWMPIFWPRSSNPDSLTQFTNSHSVSPLVKKVDAMWSPSTVTPLNGTPPFYLSTSPTKTTAQSKSHDIISGGLHRFHNSQNSGDPLVNPAPPSVAQEWESPEGNARSNLDPTTKKGVRLFGVILTEPQRLSAQHQGQLNLFPW